MPCLCEFFWVLLRVYGFQPSDAATAIRALIAAANVQVDRPAVEAGLSTLEAGRDFADGVIAYEGNWLGGETFVSFDKKAVALRRRKVNQRDYCEKKMKAKKFEQQFHKGSVVTDSLDL